jgi:hypothetical protein
MNEIIEQFICIRVSHLLAVPGVVTAGGGGGGVIIGSTAVDASAVVDAIDDIDAVAAAVS